MKKNRFFWASAAIAALTLTACADQDEFNQNDVQTAAVENAPGAIQFGTYLGENAITRAGVDPTYTNGTITSDHIDAAKNGANPLSKAGFGVFGYYTLTDKWSNGQTTYDPNFMYNQQIIYDNDATKNYWYYTPVKFWPNGIDLANKANDPSSTATETEEHKVSFFAYAPYAANVEASTNPVVLTAYPDDYATTNPYGAFPIDATANTNYFKTSKYTADPTTNGGVVGMTNNQMKNDPWVNYVMRGTSAVADDAVDLLWGLRGQYKYDETDNVDNTINSLGAAYNTDLTKQSVPERVRFLFKHALAKVGGNTGSTSKEHSTATQQCGLKVVLDVDANSSNPGVGKENQGEYQSNAYNAGTGNANTTLVTIKKVSIQDGTSATADGTNSVMDKMSDLNEWGWFNLATGQWKNQSYTGKSTTTTSRLTYDVSALSTATTTDYTLDEDIREPADDAAVLALLDRSGSVYSWKQDANTKGVVVTPAKNVYADKNASDKANDIPAIVMIPDDGTNPQTLYVTVDYVVRTADKQLFKGYSEVEQIISNEVKLKGLEANKYYTLVMHLGLTSVKFEAVVADWAASAETQFDENGEELPAGTEEDKSVWLPSNVVNTTTIYADAGTTHKHVRVSDTATGYTVNLTGLTDATTITESDVTVTATSNGGAFTAAADKGGVQTITPDRANSKVDFVLYPNQTQYDIVNTITINEKSGTETKSTTVVTLTQSKAEIILTPEVTSVPWNCNSIKVYATHPDGTPYTSTALTDKVTITPTQEGTITYNDGYFTFDPGDNTAAANRTITVVATPYTGVTATTKVVQAASTGTVDLVVDISESGNIPVGGGDKTLTATLNSSPITLSDASKVTVTTGASWLTFDGTKLTAAANSTGSARSAVVTVTYKDAAGTHIGTVTVTQAGS